MKKVKILTIILIIILITMVSFLGVYMQKQNRMENNVKDYSYAMDLKGARNIKLKVSQESRDVVRDANGTEIMDAEDLTDEKIQEKGYTKQSEPYNSENVQKAENYKKSKELIEQRLEKMGVESYEISVNEQNGEILIQVPENTDTDRIVSNINTIGNFKIIDTQTNEVLMNNNDIKLANVIYGSDSTAKGTGVYLNIEFTKEGAKKLEEISNIYVEKEEEETEDSDSEEKSEDTDSEETEEETEEKTITMMIDNETMIKTSFDEPMTDGSIQLNIGSATTDVETLSDYMTQASNIAVILDNGELPLKYDIDENKYIMSDITDKYIQYIEIGVAGIILIGIIILMFKYKANGILSSISYIGLVSIFLLLLRYTNVVISIQGIFGIAITLALNYIFVNKVLSKINNLEVQSNKSQVSVAIKESYKEFFIKIIPVCIATIVFCFVEWTYISSFGMVMFWGILLIALYNYVITNTILKIRAEE